MRKEARRILALLLVMAMTAVAVAACADSESPPPAEAVNAPSGAAATNLEERDDEDQPYSSEGMLEIEPTTDAQPLVGSWLWMNMPYYVFDADGSGTMSGTGDILWTAENGVISICTTPALCGNRCLAPAEWYYEIDGNRLTLSSTIIPDMVFEYTRG